MTRRMWTATTGRGRTFLAVGLLCCVVGLATAEQQLVRIGVLALALVAGGALVLAASGSGLSLSQSLDRPRIGPGETSVLTLTVANAGRLPIAGAVLVQPLTGALARAGAPRGTGARRRVGVLRGDERRSATLALTAATRGVHELPAAQVVVADPFGVLRLSRTAAADADGAAGRATVLTVTPTVHRLTGRPGGGPGGAAAVGRGRSVGVAGEQDSSVREYQSGDDVRRVHWRSSAHRGSLMVRQEEQPWQSRLTVVLDTRAADFTGGDTRAAEFTGGGPDSSFEWAVSAAASVVDHAGRLGYEVDLVAPTAPSMSGVPGLVAGRGRMGRMGRTADRGTPADRARVARDALDRLVGVTARPRAPGAGPGRITNPDALGPAGSGHGTHTIVAILGSVGAEDLPELADLRAGRSTAIAFLLRTTDWTPDRTGGRTVGRGTPAGVRSALAAQGWQTVEVARGDTVPAAWAAAQASGRSPSFAGPATPAGPASSVGPATPAGPASSVGPATPAGPASSVGGSRATR